MMLEVKPVPLTTLSIPIAREQIVEAILVVRTKDGVELAGDLSDKSVCRRLLYEGVERLNEIELANRPPAEDVERS